MAWRKKTPGSFGVEDRIFAEHPADEERPKVAIKEARAAGASRDEFEQEIVAHIRQHVTAPIVVQTRIDEAVKKLHRMWKV